MKISARTCIVSKLNRMNISVWWDTFYIHTSKLASLGCDLLTPGSPPNRREEKQRQHVSSKEVHDPSQIV